MNSGKKQTILLCIIGIVIALLTSIPYFILQENSIVTYHDQLDGEVINYILRAKHIWTLPANYKELMNGIPSAGIAVPAPGLLPLYVVFKPFTAFLLSLNFIKIVGFLSMFFFLIECTENKWISFVCAVIFMLLPFYPVYGLCVPGQPLMWLVYLKIKKGEMKWYYVLLTLVYSLFSSLALIGYTFIIVFGIIMLVNMIRGKWKIVIWMLVTLTIMGVTYACMNLDLINQLFGWNEGFTSHKSEIVKEYVPLKNCLYVIWKGVAYTECKQLFMMPLFLMAIMGCIWVFVQQKQTEKLKKTIKAIVTCVGFQACVFVFYVLYHSKPITNILNDQTGMIHDFNMDRFTWLMPTFWILILAYSFCAIQEALVLILPKTNNVDKIRKTSRKNVDYFIKYGLPSIAGAVLCLAALWNNDLKYNVIKLIKPSFYMMTWRQFYAEDLFREIDKTIGRDKSTYRVISVGIYSAAAAYNGFYCLDAYSNNYDVGYKHEFREVIEGELAKSENMREYFDAWGNRCCVLTMEYGNYFCTEKKWNGGFHDLNINTMKLKEMGCEYVLAGTWILNYEELGLEWIGDQPFVSDESWYNIYLYHIKE